MAVWHHGKVSDTRTVFSIPSAVSHIVMSHFTMSPLEASSR